MAESLYLVNNHFLLKLKKGRKFGAVRTCPPVRAIKVKMNFAKIISTLHAALQHVALLLCKP